jgi:hypothetical protein
MHAQLCKSRRATRDGARRRPATMLGCSPAKEDCHRLAGCLAGLVAHRLYVLHVG